MCVCVLKIALDKFEGKSGALLLARESRREISTYTRDLYIRCFIACDAYVIMDRQFYYTENYRLPEWFTVNPA